MRLRELLSSAGLVTLAFVGIGAAAAFAHDIVGDGPLQPPSGEAMTVYEEGDPPLWNDLGTLTYPISTKNADAQRYFDQGLKMAANFNHAEARRAFRKAQRLDPTCALCFLGEAIVLGPNINVPMAPEANAPAIAALRKAQALAAGASEKEKDTIAAVSARYSEDSAAERPALDAAFADAMTALSDKYPDDLELAVLASEAAMDTQPWDYWQPGGKEPKGRTADIQKRLEGVLARNPEHAWAIHLYIHLVEASDRPERAEPYADRLAALMPGAGHIVHMASHIYHRIGRHPDSLAINQTAAKMDEAYIGQTGVVGVYPIGYYTHNVHFVLISAQLLGDTGTVLTEAAKLDKLLSNDVATALPIVQPVKAAPYFAWAQYAEPDAILAMPYRPGAPAYVKAAWHYMRGIAFAVKKDAAAVRNEADAIHRIAQETDWSVHDVWGVPARPVLEVAQGVLQARAAQTEDDQDAAIALLKQAAKVEETIPYMEPPYWYYPVRQSLGAALLKAGRPQEAEKEFLAALEKTRKSAWALFGLREAAKAQGDEAAEAKAASELAKSWRGNPSLLTLDRL